MSCSRVCAVICASAQFGLPRDNTGGTSGAAPIRYCTTTKSMYSIHSCPKAPDRLRVQIISPPIQRWRCDMAIFRRHRLIGIGLPAVFWAAGALAQAHPPVEALTADERTAVERATLSDQRIREIVGSGQLRVISTVMEPDKAEAEAALEGRSQSAPTRRATVVLFDPRANRAARAQVVLPANRIAAVERIAPSDVPFGTEDGTEALALAKQDAA